MFFMPGTAVAFTNATAQSSMMVGGQFMASSSASLAQALAAGSFMPAVGSATAVSMSTLGSMTMMLGANLAIMGLTEMQAPDGGEMVSDPSFLFNGANNNIEQGQPVPLLYGTVKIGGTPISQGFKAGELKNTSYNLVNASATSQTYYGDGNNGTVATGGSNSGDDGTAAIMIK